VDERDVLAAWEGTGSPKGFPLTQAADRLGVTDRLPDDADSPALVARIAALVAAGGIAVAFVGGRLYEPAVLRDRPRASPLGTIGVRIHCVVICAVDEPQSVFGVLDPFFPSDDQPFSFGADDLAAVLTGHVLPIRR
jgi:hypothetical protein